MAIPSFRTRILIGSGPAQETSIDVGRILAGMHEREGFRMLERLVSGASLPAQAAIAAIPEWMRNAAREDGCEFPDLEQDAKAFRSSVAGPDGYSQWLDLQRETGKRERAVDRWSKHLSSLSEARFQTWKDCGCVMLAHVDEDRCGEPEMLVDSGLAPAWNEAGDATTEERAAAAAAWARRNSTPWGWATVPDSWLGISPENFVTAYAEILEEDGEHPSAEGIARVVVEAVLCDLMDNHHEDADECVKDMPGLKEIAAAWIPLSRGGVAGLDHLETLCAAWNAKQDIISYLPTHKLAIGLFPDATKEECLAFARRKVAEAAALLAEADGLWRTPVADRTGAILRLSEKGFYLSRAAVAPEWEVSAPGARTAMRFPTFELAVEHCENPVRADPVMEATKEVVSGLMTAIAQLEDSGDERPGTAPSHLLKLAREAVSRDDLTVDKASRWLGFIQGTLVTRGQLDMNAERDRTRPIFHAAYAKAGVAIPPTVAVAERKP